MRCAIPGAAATACVVRSARSAACPCRSHRRDASNELPQLQRVVPGAGGIRVVDHNKPAGRQESEPCRAPPGGVVAQPQQQVGVLWCRAPQVQLQLPGVPSDDKVW